MRVEVSTGEVLDKISILEIKCHKITDEKKLTNVRREHLTLIKELNAEGLEDWLLSDLYRSLLEVNFTLWQIEDQIRKKESLQEFDDEFVGLARSVYIVNDERAQIKREINEKTNSLLVEEKNYVSYTDSETAESDGFGGDNSVDSDGSVDIDISEGAELDEPLSD